MNSLADSLHATVDALEHELSHIERPRLAPRAKRARLVRVAGLAGGAGAFGAAAIALTMALGTGALSDEAAPAAAPTQEPRLAAVATPNSYVTSDLINVHVYVDLMCPMCANFALNQESALLEGGDVWVFYHPISFLDGMSEDGSYSTRAASALAQVADLSPEHATAFLDALWREQPRETSTLSDSELMTIAERAGVPSEVWMTFPEHRYADEVRAQTDMMMEEGLNYAPYITVEDVVVENAAADPSALLDAIAAERDARTTQP